jgi:deoxyribose-phosphate aldolase
MTNENKIACLIDHTDLKANATEAEIIKLCEEAKIWHFASVCVNSCNVKLAADLLKDSEVNVCSVVGFPLGAMSTLAKAYEANMAEKDGASEIDMVINIGWLKDCKYERVLTDIKAVINAVPSCKVKVIIETCLLTENEKIKACELIKEAGAAFAKTSTGFSAGGATAEDVSLMRRVLGPDFGIKAAGGIHDRKTAEAMIQSGATRIGASRSVEICEGKNVKI